MRTKERAGPLDTEAPKRHGGGEKASVRRTRLSRLCLSLAEPGDFGVDMAHKYIAVDDDILAELGNRPSTFLVIFDRIRMDSQYIAKKDFVPAWLIVERRLQVLRKASKIRYQRKPRGWVLVEA